MGIFPRILSGGNCTSMILNSRAKLCRTIKFLLICWVLNHHLLEYTQHERHWSWHKYMTMFNKKMFSIFFYITWTLINIVNIFLTQHFQGKKIDTSYKKPFHPKGWIIFSKFLIFPWTKWMQKKKPLNKFLS